MIGGLIGDEYRDTVNKVPWLGDIPILGWGFKSTRRELQKVNLLVFLTPHVIREADDLEYQSIRKREEFRRRSKGGLMDPRKDKEQTADVDAVDEMIVAVALDPSLPTLGGLAGIALQERPCGCRIEASSRRGTHRPKRLRSRWAERPHRARSMPRTGVGPS